MPLEATDGGRKPRVTDAEILEVVRQATDPVLSTAEIADALPIKRRGTLNRLEQLQDAGELESKSIGGRNTVWWIPDRTNASTGEDGREVRHASADATETTGSTTKSSTPTLSGSRPLSGSPSDDTPDRLEDVDFPGSKDRKACEAAVLAARDYIHEHGGATMRELVEAVMPEHPIGYDVPELQEGDRYRGSWWRRVVKPGLEALEDVKKPPRGGSTWRVA